MNTRLIIVSGLPCTGKTTIARSIAKHLQLPMVNADTYRMFLFDEFDTPSGREKQEVENASVPFLFELVEVQLATQRSCVVETPRQSEEETRRFRSMAERYGVEFVQIHCVADSAILFERFRRRSETGETHSPTRELRIEEFREMITTGRSQPLDIEGRIIEVDTSDFLRVDYAKLYAELSSGNK